MKKILLGIIAINLTFLSIITTLNYIQTANAATSADVQRVVICDFQFAGGDRCAAVDTAGNLHVKEWNSRSGINSW